MKRLVLIVAILLLSRVADASLVVGSISDKPDEFGHLQNILQVDFPSGGSATASYWMDSGNPGFAGVQMKTPHWIDSVTSVIMPNDFPINSDSDLYDFKTVITGREVPASGSGLGASVTPSLQDDAAFLVGRVSLEHYNDVYGIRDYADSHIYVAPDSVVGARLTYEGELGADRLGFVITYDLVFSADSGFVTEPVMLGTVPEPTSMGIIGIGTIGLLFRRRR